MGIGFPQEGDILPQLLVSLDELVLLPLDSLLVHLQPLSILLAAETFFLASYFSLLEHCPRSLYLKFELLETPIESLSLALVATSLSN